MNATNRSIFPVWKNRPWGLNPRPCVPEAFGRGTAPMRNGRDGHPGESDTGEAPNRHMAKAKPAEVRPPRRPVDCN